MGATYSYFTAVAISNNITGNMATTKLDLDIRKVTTVDEEKGGIIPMSNNMVEVGINNNCIDNNGNVVCQIYKATIKNIGSTNLFVDGYVTLTGGSGEPVDYTPTSNNTTMRWAQVFCDKNDTNCTTIGNTPTGATGIDAFTTLDNQTDTTGLNQDNIKTIYEDVIGSGVINNSSYDIINKNYIRVSDHDISNDTYDRENDVTSALVYNQPLGNSAGINSSSSYYFVVWLSENGHNQTQVITDKFFGGKVTFVSSGGNITGTFGNVEEDNTPLSLGDYVSLIPTKTSYTTDASMTGYGSSQTINPQELNLWRVISKNSDGTVDIISEHVSSEEIYFTGLEGYKNFVGYLNVLASQYENSAYTVGSRYFGYNGQTEYITDTSKFTNPAPWQKEPIDNSNESMGGGDVFLHEKDYNLVESIFDTVGATNSITTNLSAYWVASRFYSYSMADNYSWYGRYIGTTSIEYSNFYNYRNSKFYSNSNAKSLRPILVLKPNLKYSGDGSQDDPWIVGE